MSFTITITQIAEAELRALSAREQRLVEAGIQARLVDQPTTETKAVKKLRPNPFAEFELRIGNLRVLYNVKETEVMVLLVGLKEGNKLIVGGEEFHEHKDNPAESAGGEPAGDAK